MIPTSTDATVVLAARVPARVDGVVVLVHKDTNAADTSLPPEQQATLARLLESKLVSGKSNEVSVQLLEGEPSRRLVVIGLGSRESFSVECLREAGVALARAMRRHRFASAAIALPNLPETLPGLPKRHPAGPADEMAVEALTQGFLLGAFKYQEYKKPKAETDNKPLALTIIADRDARLTRALERGIAVAEGQNFARTIASRPGNDINPLTLGDVAQQLARELKLKIRVLDDREMRRLKMGGILAVGGGSATPPRIIVLEHAGEARGKKGKTKGAPLLIVGKTITFDTGGISIKPAEKMGAMIYDKCGGMTVLGLMYAVAKLKLPTRVIGILAAAENHVSDRAYRPGDILRMYNGVTVDVTNTDAEGRLVLGDAMAWGVEQYKPSAMIDLATLTGGVIVALGKTMAGLMSNNDELVEQLTRFATDAGEKVWRLPLGDDQRDQIKATHAHIVNSAGREAHPLQGGAFLSHFVPNDLPWVHLDIAGVGDVEKDTALYTKGATGWGVRTLVRWVEQARD